MERQIEARPADDSMGSFVRCLYFARTFLVSGEFRKHVNMRIILYFTILPRGVKTLSSDAFDVSRLDLCLLADLCLTLATFTKVSILLTRQSQKLETCRGYYKNT